MGEWGKDLCILRLGIILYRGEYPVSSPDHFILGARALFSYWIGGLVNYRTPQDVVERRKISFPFREMNHDSLACVVTQKRFIKSRHFSWSQL
jgi:hypothetical protein